MIATNTTRMLVTNTTRLRAWARRVDPYTAGSLLLIALIVAGGLIRNAVPHAPAPSPIDSIATPALGGGQHGTVRRLDRAPAAFRALPTAIVPTAAPLPTPEPALVAAPEQQIITVQNAPAPTAFVADPQIVYSPAGSSAEISVPADAPRYCTGFGDWRDYDAMFATSPACHPTP